MPAGRRGGRSGGGATSVAPSGAAGGVLGGTYPNPAFAADMATQAELDAHDVDTTSVHGIANTASLLTTASTPANLGALTFTSPAFYNTEPKGTTIDLVGANQFRGCLVTVPVRATVSQARIGVATSSGNISVGLYTADGATRLATTGAVACPAGPSQATIAFTGSVTLAPGVYFLGVSADNTTAKFWGNDATQVKGGQAVTTAHPAPAGPLSFAAESSSVVCVGLY